MNTVILALLLLYFAVIPFLVLKDKNFNRLLFFTIFMYPLFPPNAGFEISSSLPLLTFQKVLVLALFLGWLNRRKEMKYFSYISISSIGKSINIFFFVLVILVFFNFTISSFIQLLNLLGNWYVLYAVLFTTMVHQWQLNEEQGFEKKVVKYFLLSSAIIAFFGIFYSFTGINVFVEFLPHPDSVHVVSLVKTTRISSNIYRALSSIGYPIQLGFFLLIIIPLFLSKVFAFSKLKSLIVISLFLICFVLTQSRGAYMGFFSFILFYLFIDFAKGFRYSLLGFFLVLIVISTDYGQGFIDLVLSIGNESNVDLYNRGADFRYDAIKITLGQATEVPFLGFGLDAITNQMTNFDSPMQKILMRDFGRIMTDVPIYIYMFWGLGSMGFLAFMYMLTSPLLLLWSKRNILFDKPEKSKIFLISLIAFYIANGTTFALLPWFSFFIIMALISFYDIKNITQENTSMALN